MGGGRGAKFDTVRLVTMSPWKARASAAIASATIEDDEDDADDVEACGERSRRGDALSSFEGVCASWSASRDDGSSSSLSSHCPDGGDDLCGIDDAPLEPGRRVDDDDDDDADDVTMDPRR
jgi:hypothetical protein